MDRFLMRISVGYPNHEEELDIVRRRRGVSEQVHLQPVAEVADILAIQNMLGDIHVDDAILEYIVHIVEVTRRMEGVLMGVSPRGSIALTKAACAAAILDGRSYVLPDDVKRMAVSVLAHRLVLKNRSGAEGTTAADVIAGILRDTRVPKMK